MTNAASIERSSIRTGDLRKNNNMQINSETLFPNHSADSSVDTAAGAALHELLELLSEFEGVELDNQVEAVRIKFCSEEHGMFDELWQQVLADAISRWKCPILSRTFDIDEEFEMNKPKEPTRLIDGVLPQGGTMMISGGMKTNKSWTALEISLSIATGREWLGFQCARGNVLHIDSELSEYTFHHRITSLRKGMGISKMPMGSLRALRLAGEVCEIDKLSEELIAKYKPGDLSAIVIDPIYVMLGNREENRNEHMKEIGLIMGRIAKMTGAAVIFVHHHAKGEQKGKRAIERASGGGALGRFVSTSMDIAMQKHDKFKFEFTVRDYRSPDAFLAIRAIPGPTWERLSEPVGEEDGDEGLNENDVKKVADLVETNEKISQAKWFERARAAGFGRPTFEEILEWLAENGIATNEPGPRRSKLWSFPARKGERFESQFED